MSAREVPVKLSLGSAQTQVTATVEDWDGLARVKRAVGLMCICWAAAGVSIFIPLAHWILVPSLLLSGPILFVLRFTERTTLMELKGDCPKCKAPGKFLAGGRFKSPKSVNCDGCGNLLELTQ